MPAAKFGAEGWSGRLEGQRNWKDPAGFLPLREVASYLGPGALHMAKRWSHDLHDLLLHEQREKGCSRKEFYSCSVKDYLPTLVV